MPTLDVTAARSRSAAPTPDPVLAAEYRRQGWWTDETLNDVVRKRAVRHPDDPAWSDERRTATWVDVDVEVQQLAEALVAVGVAVGDRVAVCLPDSIEVHVALLAVERAGAVVVGLGARAGRREIAHLLTKAQAPYLITAHDHGREPAQETVERLRADGLEFAHLVYALGDEGAPEVLLDGRPVELGTNDAGSRADRVSLDHRRRGADELWLINSTSGTTGMPKAVLHTQNRWHYFHLQAQANGDLRDEDILLSLVPAPFGFGIWTSHVTPIKLGAKTVVFERFDPVAAMAAIERERVSVMCCVSTQFIMMLAHPAMVDYDLSSLRVVFTGGEAVPYAKAHAFESRTGATILQFYGSNETGLLSGTTLTDPLDRRLGTAGRIIPEMQVRLYDGTRDVTDLGHGQPACHGPATCLGYLDDDDANAALFTQDGWMLMGDICSVDADGYLTVSGRISEFVVRGGKNISLAVVENDLLEHPAVAHAAAVPMPDPVLGERVCAYVELRAGAELTLEQLVAHLARAGVSKELYPEHLVVLDELPRSSGAKIAKGELRADAAERARALG